MERQVSISVYAKLGISTSEVIADKSVTDDRATKRFAFVNNCDEKPKRRVFEVLNSQGMQSNQQVTFLSVGGDAGRDLQLFMKCCRDEFKG